MIENYELIREMHTNKSHPFTVLTDLRDANHGLHLVKTVNKTYYEVRFKN